MRLVSHYTELSIAENGRAAIMGYNPDPPATPQQISTRCRTLRHVKSPKPEESDAPSSGLRLTVVGISSLRLVEYITP